MTIGIDLDDTIINTYEKLIMEISNYYHLSYDEVYDKRYLYEDLFSDPAFKSFMDYYSNSFDTLTIDVEIKPDAVEIINKLHDEGHKIVIITDRDHKLYANPYKTSNDYLISKGLKFDKLIADTIERGIIASSERIEIFIDNSFESCQAVMDYGISVLQMKTYFDKGSSDINLVENWYQVYNYIQNISRK